MNRDTELLTDLLGATAAKEIIGNYGSVRDAARAGMELARVPGIGRVKAKRLLAAADLARRLWQPPAKGSTFRSASDVWAWYRQEMSGLEQEQFVVCALDTRNRLLKTFIPFRGCLTSCPVHPREVFRVVLREAAAAIVFLHNHPS